MSLIRIKIACRAEKALTGSTISKIALHCQVEVDQVLVVRDMPTVYQVPLLLHEQGLIPLLQSKLDLHALNISPALVDSGKELYKTWEKLTTQTFHSSVEISLVGKYPSHDAYLSVEKSLEHSAMHLGLKLNLQWVDSEHLEPKTQINEPEKYQKAWDRLKESSGIITPGGFGNRGVEGMILAANWARDNGKPYLGVRIHVKLCDLFQKLTGSNRCASVSKSR